MLQLLIAGARLAIFQFHDVRIFYVLIDVAEGQQEDVGSHIGEGSTGIAFVKKEQRKSGHD